MTPLCLLQGSFRGPRQKDPPACPNCSTSRRRVVTPSQLLEQSIHEVHGPKLQSLGPWQGTSTLPHKKNVKVDAKTTKDGDRNAPGGGW